MEGPSVQRVSHAQFSPFLNAMATKLLLISVGATIYQAAGPDGCMHLSVSPTALVAEVLSGTGMQLEIDVVDLGVRSGAELTFQTLFRVRDAVLQAAEDNASFVLVIGRPRPCTSDLRSPCGSEECHPPRPRPPPVQAQTIWMRQPLPSTSCSSPSSTPCASAWCSLARCGPVTSWGRTGPPTWSRLSSWQPTPQLRPQVDVLADLSW